MNARAREDLELTAASQRLVLFSGVILQIIATVTVQYPTFLIPYLHSHRGISLTHAGMIASASMIGAVVGIVIWGVVLDRIDERVPIMLAMASAIVFVLLFTSLDSLWLATLLLGLTGATCSVGNVASSRLIATRFAHNRRGTVFGVRQMSQPLSLAICAISVPLLASHHGLIGAASVPVVGCFMGFALAMKLHPRRSVSTTRLTAPQMSEPASAIVASPYRNRALVRIHASSMTLVVPQMALVAIALVWMTTEMNMSAVSASVYLTGTQILGAFLRLAFGMWADHRGLRFPTMRFGALITGATLVFLLIFHNAPFAIPVFLAASTISLGANSLALVSAADLSPESWMGRVTAIHTATQMATAAAMPLFATFIVAAFNYPTLFAVAAVSAGLSYLCVPRSDETTLA